MPDDDYLPINYLNHLSYCPRRFWYMYIQGEIAVNAPMLEGTLQHQRADTPGRETDDNGRTVRRRSWVWSDRLHIAGFADFVEEHRPPSSLLPVEYKHGRRAHWDNDQIQLCAQALCLEEMTGAPVTHGEIFYRQTRRRLTVPFDAALRERTTAAVAAAHLLREQDIVPAPITDYNKCRLCSLEPICLPREVRQLESTPHVR